MEDIKKTFNELAKIAKIQEAWGKNVSANLDEKTGIELATRLERARFQRQMSTNDPYREHEDERYDMIMSGSAHIIGYERSVYSLKRTLAEGDANTEVILSVLSEDFAKSFMPPVTGVPELRAIAEKYGLKQIQRLLP